MEQVFNYSQWPWKNTSKKFPSSYKGGRPYPKLSIVIPSFNQGTFIEETLLSVINQGYPNLELIVIDGGSKDNTVEILNKYKEHLTYWVSEPDRGQSHAINKGLKKATGEWIAWLNSDDCYLQDAFYYLFHEINIDGYDFIFGHSRTGRTLSNSREVTSWRTNELTLGKVLRFFFSYDYIIPSQSVFFKSNLLDTIGYINEDLHYCMDVEWYARVLLGQSKVYKYHKTICFFRVNEGTKTGSLSNIDFEDNKMGKEAESIALNYSKKLSLFEKIKFNWLFDYYLMYSKEPGKYDDSSLAYIMKIVLLHPFESLSDRRVLGLVKRKLMGGKFKRNRVNNTIGN